MGLMNGYKGNDLNKTGVFQKKTIESTVTKKAISATKVVDQGKKVSNSSHRFEGGKGSY